MQVTASEFGVDQKTIYVNGTYCGLCSTDSLSELQRLERSLRRSARLRRLCAAVMSRHDARPLGGFAGEAELIEWLRRNGSYAGHLWIDAGRGVLWSPAAWSVAMRLVRVKDVD